MLLRCWFHFRCKVSIFLFKNMDFLLFIEEMKCCLFVFFVFVLLFLVCNSIQFFFVYNATCHVVYKNCPIDIRLAIYFLLHLFLTFSVMSLASGWKIFVCRRIPTKNHSCHSKDVFLHWSCNEDTTSAAGHNSHMQTLRPPRGTQATLLLNRHVQCL